jgi:hypothetical protein
MQYKVLRDLVQIEILPDKDAFDVSDLQFAKVIAKGNKCSKDYEVGDTVGFIKKTAYVGDGITFIFDENVLMVRK